MMNHQFFKHTMGQLIVSCQAVEGEPLYSPYIMSRMAVAAMQGGAAAIRANTVADIEAIRAAVPLPMIGIIKKVCPGSQVYITPTEHEVSALVACGVEVIAMDATSRPRPGGRSLTDFFPSIRRSYPDQLFMADCASYEDALLAQELGFDIAGTTLFGYTAETEGSRLPNIPLIAQIGKNLSIPVIAEGGIWQPWELAEIIQLPGVHAAVIGSAITRPMEITQRFVKALHKKESNDEDCSA